MLENWILEGDEQCNVPVRAFVFLSFVFGLIFFGAKLSTNDIVNMLLSIQKLFLQEKKSPQIKLTVVYKSWTSKRKKKHFPKDFNNEKIFSLST